MKAYIGSRWLVGIACAFSAASLVYSQGYPIRRIAMIVPLPAGASADSTARVFAEHLKDKLGQPVIVENRPGAGGVVGTEMIARAPSDGYTIGLAMQVLTSPRALLPAATFDAVKDFEPIGRVVTSPFVIVVPAELPVRTLKEFIFYARANPGKLNYGVVPNSMMQLDMARFGLTTNSRIADVPFNGAAQIATALMGGQIQMGFLGTAAFPNIKSGKLIALGVTSKTRWGVAPDIPSTLEQGIEFESSYWYGFVAPGGTSREIIQRLAKETADVAKKAEVKDAIRKLSLEPVEPSPEEMTQFMKKERAQGVEVARAIGLGS